jgi:hypothetical protein
MSNDESIKSAFNVFIILTISFYPSYTPIMLVDYMAMATLKLDGS